jgi:hypothetical protein
VSLDMVPYYQQAADFLTTGRLPDRGNISSYGSYFPPGASYLLIPGVLLFRDGRLQALFGDALVFFGALVFTYLCAREIGGRRVGLASALVVAVSRLGFQTLVPIGNPFFIVSTLFFLIRWIKNRSAWMLGIALVLGALGAYHHLVIALFLFVIPLLWLIYRPPVHGRVLVVSILLGAAIWFPYLRFEAGRGFIDIESQFLRRDPVQLAKGGSSGPNYCYASLSGEPDVRNDTYLPYIGGPEIEQRVIYPTTEWKNQAAFMSCRLLTNLDRNFDTDLFLLGANRILNTIVWFLFLTGFSALGWSVLQTWRPVSDKLEGLRRREWILLLVAAAGAAFLYITLNPDLVAHLAADRSLDRNMQLAVGQWRDFLPWIWGSLLLGLFLSFREIIPGKEKVIYFLAFTIPWILMTLIAESDRPYRFLFLWPLQVILAVLCLQSISRRLPRAGFAFAIAVLALGVAVLPADLYAGRLAAMWTQGYAGRDSDQWKVVQYLSEHSGVGEGRPMKIEYWLDNMQAPEVPGVYRFEDWFTYLLESSSGVRVLDPGIPGDSEAGSWAVVDSRVGLPDALEGIAPAAVFGNYMVFRSPE